MAAIDWIVWGRRNNRDFLCLDSEKILVPYGKKPRPESIPGGANSL